jgi:hypothetical protein
MQTSAILRTYAYSHIGCAIAHTGSGRLLTAAVRVRFRIKSCGICGRQMALRQVLSEYFSFPCQFSFHRLPHTHHLSSGAGTRSQIVSEVPKGLTLTHSKKNYCHILVDSQHTTFQDVKSIYFILIPYTLLIILAAGSKENTSILWTIYLCFLTV